MKNVKAILSVVAKIALGALAMLMSMGVLCLLYWLFSNLATFMHLLMWFVLAIAMYILGDLTYKMFIDPLFKRRRHHEEDTSDTQAD